jgi:hypothetical protein
VVEGQLPTDGWRRMNAMKFCRLSCFYLYIYIFISSNDLFDSFYTFGIEIITVHSKQKRSSFEHEIERSGETD